MNITIKTELVETLTTIASEQGFTEAEYVQKIVDDFLTIQYKDKLIKDIVEQPIETLQTNKVMLEQAMTNSQTIIEEII